MESGNLFVMGISCVAGAIVGGGFRIFGIEIPLLSSIQRQVLLGLLGFGLISPTAYFEFKTINETHQCELYAKEAVEQFDENMRRGCGQVGERWHNIYAGHKGWCLTQSNGSFQNEFNERKNALESCNKTS